MLNRKKLQKLLGKDVEWTATMYRYGENMNNVMLVDVKHKGKLMTDHVWISNYDSIKQFELGTELRFNAVAVTYKDSKGRRKHGLKRCHSFMVNDTKYIDAIKDGEYRAKRLNGLV